MRPATVKASQTVCAGDRLLDLRGGDRREEEAIVLVGDVGKLLRLRSGVPRGEAAASRPRPVDREVVRLQPLPRDCEAVREEEPEEDLSERAADESVEAEAHQCLRCVLA